MLWKGELDMSKFKRFMTNFMSSVAMVALVCGVVTSNSACGMIFHQPKEPKAMDKYKL